MKKRFKDKDFNNIYWVWVTITKEQVEKLMNSTSGSNRDDAFKRGYRNLPCKYQRNWMLYPVYIAGKEWKKVNIKMSTEEIGGIKESIKHFLSQ